MSLSVADKVHDFPKTRFDEIPRLLRDEGLDVVVASSPENVTYTTGVYDHGLPILKDRITATVIPANGAPVCLVLDRSEAAIKRYSWIKETVGYQEHKESPIRVLAKILEERGLGSGIVAIEDEHLSVRFYEELKEYLPRAHFRNGSAVLARARSIKTDEEVEFISAAVKATETAHLKVYQMTKPGDREIAMARRLRAQNIIEGADFVDNSTVAAGRNGLEGRHVADNTRLKAGDVLMVDSSGKFNGYYSDMARPVVIGKPSARQQSIWRKLRDAQRRGVECMQVGVRAGEAYDSLRRQKDYHDIWFYGHGLGVFVHDAPMLLPYYENGLRTTTNFSAAWELRPNMLLMVEFGLVDREGGNFYHFEDLVLVTDSGPRILSNVIDTTELFVVE